MYTSFNDYRKAWDEAYYTTPKVPLNVDIELASLCNLACPFCFWGEADFNKEMQKPSKVDGKPMKRLMPTKMAYDIIDECAKIGVPALKFNWRGESTIHPDFSNILKYAADKFMSLSVTNGIKKITPCFQDILVNTNGNFKEDRIGGLLKTTKVMFSLDSTIPEIYKIMRVNGDLELAIKNIKLMVERGHRNIWVRRVMAKENEKEPFAENVKKIFGPTVNISQHHCFDRNENEQHADNCGYKDEFERTYCGYPSQRIMVASDGTCFPCCVDYDATMPIGHISDGLLNIWNGDKMEILRNELKNDIFKSKTCKNCTSWMSYKSEKRKYVGDVKIHG